MPAVGSSGTIVRASRRAGLGLLAAVAGVMVATATPLSAAEPAELDCRAATVDVENGPGAPARSRFYHLSQGSERIPFVIAEAMRSVTTGEPFLEDLERFGLIPDPCSEHGLPIGLTVAPTVDIAVDMLGINCAACHVAQLEYRGETIRVDGGPAQFDVEAFQTDLLLSAYELLFDPPERARFLTRLARSLLQARDPSSAAGSGHERRVADLSDALAAELAALVDSPAVPSPEPVAGDPELVAGVQALRLFVARLRSLKMLGEISPVGGTDGGHGRTDAFGFARIFLFGAENRGPKTAPVSYPHLWGTHEARWLHWNANTTATLQRNIGQAIGNGGIHDPETLASTVPVPNMMRLDAYVGRLTAPRWPEEALGRIDRARAARGARHYRRLCAGCHEGGRRGPDGLLDHPLIAPEVVGTDPAYLRDFSQRLPLPPYPGEPDTFPGQLAALLGDMESVLVRGWRDFDLETRILLMLDRITRPPPRWRDTGAYVARPLAGVWATAPYLHNNSVPSLYLLLQPAADRPRQFRYGLHEFDPVNVGLSLTPTGRGEDFDASLPGNANTGHEYGVNLGEAQKLELIEYLKTR